MSGLGQSFVLVAFVSHAGCISVKALQVWYMVAKPHEADWGVPLVLISSSVGIPCHCSSLASLASLSPFQSTALSTSPADSFAGIFFTSDTGVFHQMSVDQVLSRSSHGQRIQNFSDYTNFRVLHWPDVVSDDAFSIIQNIILSSVPWTWAWEEY